MHGFKNLENTVVSHYLEPQFRSQTFVSIKHCYFTLDNLNLGSLKNSVNSNQICLLLRKCSHIYTPFILNERRKKEHISKLKKFMWDKMHKTEISKVALLVVVFIKYKWHIKWACLQTTETYDFTAPYPSEFLVTLCGGRKDIYRKEGYTQFSFILDTVYRHIFQYRLEWMKFDTSFIISNLAISNLFPGPQDLLHHIVFTRIMYMSEYVH